MVGKVAIIGAGPCGMELLRHFGRQKLEGKVIPEVKCFEKCRDWGGQWNYTWRTGTDEFGEKVHSSMYHNLWSNAPKECLEFPGYTFLQHFGKPIPSFPPREVVFDYLKGRWKQANVRDKIWFCHAVKDVCYNSATDDFTVVVKDLENDVVLDGERLDYVIVASGHYSMPNVPSFPGLDAFTGHVAHSHYFRDAKVYADKTVLLIGASYSAEDIAIMLVKYGANNVICSWRSRPMPFNLPGQIQQRPLLLRLDGNTAHFKDGSTAAVDAVIMCTGYKHDYPFLRENLRLKSGNVFYTPNLYKGIVWTKGGNGKLLYVSSQDNAYTFTMFDVQARWAVKLIQGEMTLPALEEQERQWRSWEERLNTIKEAPGLVDFQTDYIKDIVKDLGADYPHDLDVASIFHDWLVHKQEDLVSYRDKSFKSKFSGTQAPAPQSNFMEAYDDSLESFTNLKLNKLMEAHDDSLENFTNQKLNKLMEAHDDSQQSFANELMLNKCANSKTHDIH